MLMVYAKNTAKKTGFIATQDLIAPEGGRYRPVNGGHPQAHLAVELMNTMSAVFLSTDRSKRLTLRESYEGALKLDPTFAGFTQYLSATSKAAERILFK